MRVSVKLSINPEAVEKLAAALHRDQAPEPPEDFVFWSLPPSTASATGRAYCQPSIHNIKEDLKKVLAPFFGKWLKLLDDRDLPDPVPGDFFSEVQRNSLINRALKHLCDCRLELFDEIPISAPFRPPFPLGIVPPLNTAKKFTGAPSRDSSFPFQNYFWYHAFLRPDNGGPKACLRLATRKSFRFPFLLDDVLPSALFAWMECLAGKIKPGNISGFVEFKF